MDSKRFLQDKKAQMKHLSYQSWGTKVIAKDKSPRTFMAETSETPQCSQRAILESSEDKTEFCPVKD